MILTPATSAQLIASKMEYIQLNTEAIDSLAQMMIEKASNDEYDITKWKLDNPLHPQEMNEHSANWIFVVDSLNFSFWPDAGKEFTIEGEVGYWALCAAINRALRESIPITDSAFYQNLTLEQAQHIFRTDQESIPIPMLQERVQVLNQNGQILLQKFNGNFVNCIRLANSSALKLLDIIYENFACFRDESLYKDLQVTFLKRAQILVADLWGCFEGKDLGRFEDIDQLTMFADYRIPQALHFFDVLKYSDQLTDRLRSNALLQNGEPFEVEIRGASIHAVELIKGKMVQISKVQNFTCPIPNSIQIDFYLWGYRRDNAERIDLKSPYHKVRSIFY